MKKRLEALDLTYDEAEEAYTFDSLAEDYRILAELEEIAGTETEDTPGKVNPDWNVRTALAIRIIREERYKVRRELNFEREEKDKAKRRAQGLE